MYEAICCDLSIGYMSGLVRDLGFTIWPYLRITQL